MSQVTIQEAIQEAIPETRSPSLVVRFLDSFLQERNIKWVLAVGMSILLGSSLLLVTTHWDTYTLLWQSLIVLGYSVAIHAAGQWTYHRLGLRRTGTVLQGLTVLLIPVLFLAIHWLPEIDAAESPPGYLQWLLFAATAAFSIPAARRIFAHFLRSTQPTFLACYLILSMAGTLLPLTPSAFAPLVVGGLWAAFAIGSVKVSRRVFWLTEERRSPRILGFLPIALLGAQFLCLYGVHPGLHVDLEWIGFGCVLVAIPVLATADSLACVFQQRTGNLVRPLPWSLVLPVIVGLILCSAAMMLSGTGLMRDATGAPPTAFLATALVASGLMLLLARRSEKEAFVWAMLIGLTIAYNTSPRFFMETVNVLKAQGASAVRESKLPLAFYGLTYLPLLTAMLVAGKVAGGRELIARPLRLYSFGLMSLLWTLSLTHEKAMFPVGLVLVGLAATQLRVLRFWPALVIGLLCWISAAFGFPAFSEKVLGLPATEHAHLASLTGAAVGLLAIGGVFDASLRRLLPKRLADRVTKPCEMASVVVFTAVTLVSFAAFDGTTRAAGLVAFAGLAWAARSSQAARLPLAMLLNVHILAIWPTLLIPGADLTTVMLHSDYLALPMAAAAALSLVAWEFAPASGELEASGASAFRGVLRGLGLAGVLAMLRYRELTGVEVPLAIATFGLTALSEFIGGCRTRSETRVWIGEAIVLAGWLYLHHFGVLVVHHEIAMFVLLGGGIGLKVLKECTAQLPALAVLSRPLGMTSFVMPLLAVMVGVARHFLAPVDWLGANSLVILTAAAFYFWHGIENQRKAFHVLAAVILNIALALLGRELAWSDPQFFMVPIGISIMALVELLKGEIPERFHNPLRYLGALVILVSPTFHIVKGDWLPLLTLMVASTAIVLVGIGLRVRALLYAGTAFLFADLVALLVRGSVENANLLWLAGLGLGGGIVFLGAYCEKHREDLIARMHLIASSLKTWN
jgi:hypothetical protein